MRATPPFPEVPGDNQQDIAIGIFNIRPCIMARSGDLIGFTTTKCVWRFGFLPESEAALAYGVQIDDANLGFLWVLSTRKTGKILESFRGYATSKPNSFNKVIDG